MSKQHILAEFAEIVREIVGIPVAEVQPEAHLRDDLDIDSLSLVEIMVAVEDRFGVATPDEIAADLETVDAVLNHIEQHASAGVA
ncbi:acyl carrier protein [Nonomuraea helvata]|uniref:Acyl carrier protein n=1 Tax=Nonomuraea helvata TaxID=37484 RepID=A0ABV5S5L7_9ACTN